MLLTFANNLDQSVDTENKFKLEVKKNKSFLLEAIRSIKTTGTVWPSSSHLISKMLSPIDFKKADCIVEFGVGNGNITRELLGRMKPGSKLLAFEINDQFYKQQKEELKDLRLVLINDSAEEIETYLKQLNITKVNHVVSGLPLSILGKAFCESLLTKIHKILPPHGKYIQFQYSLSQYSLIKKHFKKVKIKFTALNIPPAIVYVCTK
ncbi:MAG: class I SAM-dependent methyltransferase [Bacteroidia bacterium]